MNAADHRTLNRLLQSAAREGGTLSPGLLEELQAAYLNGGKGARSKIARRLAVIGIHGHQMEEIRNIGKYTVNRAEPEEYATIDDQSSGQRAEQRGEITPGATGEI